MRTSIAFVLVLNLVAVFATFPAYLTRCGKDELDLNACVLKRAQEGLKKVLHGDESLGLQSYLPLKYKPKTHLGNDDVKFDISNLTVVNINSSTVTGAKWDMQQRKVNLTFHFDNVVWEFDLDIGGTFNAKEFNSDGIGHATQTFLNGGYSYEMQYGPVKKDGVSYPEVKHGESDYYAETILYSFSGIDEAENAYLNKHQKQFDKELHTQICGLIYDNITPAFDAVFSVTPIDELFV